MKPSQAWRLVFVLLALFGLALAWLLRTEDLGVALLMLFLGLCCLIAVGTPAIWSGLEGASK